MQRLAILIVVTLAVGCGSTTEVGELEVTVDTGGRLRSNEVTVVVPPNTVVKDRTFTVVSANAELPGAVSRQFHIEPADIRINQPVTVSIPVQGAHPTRVQIMMVDADGAVIAKHDAQIDAVTGEARGVLPQLGAFVLVDLDHSEDITPDTATAIATTTTTTTTTTTIRDNDSLPYEPGDFSQGPATPSTPASTSTGPSAPTSTTNDYSFVGDWVGSGEYAGLRMAFDKDSFTVHQNQDLVREGTYQANNGSVTLTDVTGAIESGTYGIEQLGDRLVLNLQAGQLIWYRPGSQPAPDHLADTSGAQDTTPDSVWQPLANENTAGTRPAQNTQAEGKQNNIPGFLGRIGTGLKNLGQNTVEGAKNVGRGIGNQFKREADNKTRDISNPGGQTDTSQHPIFATPLAGVTPSLPEGHACLISHDEMQRSLGFSLAEPRSVPASDRSSDKQWTCHYLNLEGHGSVRITFYKRTYGNVPESWNRQLRNYPDRYRRLEGIGDDARWTFGQGSRGRIEVEILMGNSVLSLEREGGSRHISNLSSQDAPRIIEITKLAASRLRQS